MEDLLLGQLECDGSINIICESFDMLPIQGQTLTSETLLCLGTEPILPELSLIVSDVLANVAVRWNIPPFCIFHLLLVCKEMPIYVNLEKHVRKSSHFFELPFTFWMVFDKLKIKV